MLHPYRIRAFRNKRYPASPPLHPPLQTPPFRRQPDVENGPGRSRFDDGNGPLDDARIVAPFDDQLAVFLRIRIDGILALTDGRRRFNGQAEDKGHAVGNAAVNAAVVIGLGLYDAIIVIESIVGL